MEALNDPDIASLAVESIYGIANRAHSKYLISDEAYKCIISGGNDKQQFIVVLLDCIATQIGANPDALETFITQVLDKIGPPVSNLGERLRKSFSHASDINVHAS